MAKGPKDIIKLVLMCYTYQYFSICVISLSDIRGFSKSNWIVLVNEVIGELFVYICIP